MRYVQHKQRIPVLSFALLTLVLAFVLAACGSAGGTGSAPTSPATPAPTPVNGYGTANGCPSDMVVGTAPAKANVQVVQADTNSTITAHSGDVIEVRLPFGQKWTGPTKSQGGLELQSPSGYAWKTDHVCVWRFTATQTGTTELDFFSQAICKTGQMCPMYVAKFPFTIDVK